MSYGFPDTGTNIKDGLPKFDLNRDYLLCIRDTTKGIPRVMIGKDRFKTRLYTVVGVETIDTAFRTLSHNSKVFIFWENDNWVNRKDIQDVLKMVEKLSKTRQIYWIMPGWPFEQDLTKGMDADELLEWMEAQSVMAE